MRCSRNILPLRCFDEGGPQALRIMSAAGTHIDPRKKGGIKIARRKAGTRSFDQRGALLMVAKQRERLAHHLGADGKVLVDLNGAARIFQSLLRPIEEERID